jgi:hypothetical protein
MGIANPSTGSEHETSPSLGMTPWWIPANAGRIAFPSGTDAQWQPRFSCRERSIFVALSTASKDSLTNAAR